MTACSYAGRGASNTAHLVAAVSLGHRLATHLAEDLNDASPTQDDPLLCLAAPNFSVLMARGTDGASLAAVTLMPGCREVAASNGNVTRYLKLSDPSFQQAIERVARTGNRRPAH
jgi:hypothetical protein